MPELAARLLGYTWVSCCPIHPLPQAVRDPESGEVTFCIA